jgi:hypothetical protein
MENFDPPLRPTDRAIPEKFLVAFSFAGEQRELVRTIAEAVEKRIGSGNVFLDEWFRHYIDGHDADLRLQEIYGRLCELVVVCVSGDYGAKPWAQAEYEVIRARVMRSRESVNGYERHDVLPIRVGEGAVDGIYLNTSVSDARVRPVEETAELIVERLRLIVPDLGPRVDTVTAETLWPKIPEPLLWPMADHNGIREAFKRLLARDSSRRFLALVGATETGKSHITKQMFANALQMSELACGRFDFKGTIGMDAEVRAFVQDLDVPVPLASPRLVERFGQILDTLKRRACPALLIFDTYEAAGEAQGWAETELLPSLIRATWLRVVIAGQQVPLSAGSVWATAGSSLQLKPPLPDEWYEYGRQHREGVTKEFVETACQLASHKASVLAQLLGPAK